MKAIVALHRDVAIETTVQDGERSIPLKPGDRITLNLV